VSEMDRLQPLVALAGKGVGMGVAMAGGTELLWW
jgi:hypothetical protein